MDRIVPITEARQNLSGLVDEARHHEVFILKHGRRVAVLISVEAYEAALGRIEQLEDENSVLRYRLNPTDVEPFVPSEDATLT